jgi:hypothetical protein
MGVMPIPPDKKGLLGSRFVQNERPHRHFDLHHIPDLQTFQGLREFTPGHFFCEFDIALFGGGIGKGKIFRLVRAAYRKRHLKELARPETEIGVN